MTPGKANLLAKIEKYYQIAVSIARNIKFVSQKND